MRSLCLPGIYITSGHYVCLTIWHLLNSSRRWLHLARTNFQQMSNFHKLTGLPKQRKRISKIIASGCNIFIPVILATYRGSHYQCQVAIIYSPLALFWLTQPGKLPPLPKNGRVWFAKSCSNLIGQPFYKGRPILGRVASVAGASAAATLAWEGCLP
jgi:hypothetical protein